MNGPTFLSVAVNKLDVARLLAVPRRTTSIKPRCCQGTQACHKTCHFRIAGTCTQTVWHAVHVRVDVGDTCLCVAPRTGVADGLGLGHNSRAALITRGVAEITRLAVKLGANPLTLSGLAGMGDLILTCTGGQSRNRRVGIELGKGRKLAEIIGEMDEVAEGVKTSKSAYELSIREKVDMPITKEVYKMLYQDKSPVDTLKDLMGRDLKGERDY